MLNWYNGLLGCLYRLQVVLVVSICVLVLLQVFSLVGLLCSNVSVVNSEVLLVEQVVVLVGLIWVMQVLLVRKFNVVCVFGLEVGLVRLYRFFWMMVLLMKLLIDLFQQVNDIQLVLVKYYFSFRLRLFDFSGFRFGFCELLLVCDEGLISIELNGCWVLGFVQRLLYGVWVMFLLNEMWFFSFLVRLMLKLRLGRMQLYCVFFVKGCCLLDSMMWKLLLVCYLIDLGMVMIEVDIILVVLQCMFRWVLVCRLFSLLFSFIWKYVVLVFFLMKLLVVCCGFMFSLMLYLCDVYCVSCFVLLCQVGQLFVLQLLNRLMMLIGCSRFIRFVVVFWFMLVMFQLFRVEQVLVVWMWWVVDLLVFMLNWKWLWLKFYLLLMCVCLILLIWVCVLMCSICVLILFFWKFGLIMLLVLVIVLVVLGYQIWVLIGRLLLKFSFCIQELL